MAKKSNNVLTESTDVLTLISLNGFEYTVSWSENTTTDHTLLIVLLCVGGGIVIIGIVALFICKCRGSDGGYSSLDKGLNVSK